MCKYFWQTAHNFILLYKCTYLGCWCILVVCCVSVCGDCHLPELFMVVVRHNTTTQLDHVLGITYYIPSSFSSFSSCHLFRFTGPRVLWPCFLFVLFPSRIFFFIFQQSNPSRGSRQPQPSGQAWGGLVSSLTKNRDNVSRMLAVHTTGHSNE